MKYAIHMTTEHNGSTNDWVLLKDGAWCSPTNANETAKPPYFHVAQLFTSKRKAQIFIAARYDRKDLRVVQWGEREHELSRDCWCKPEITSARESA